MIDFEDPYIYIPLLIIIIIIMLYLTDIIQLNIFKQQEGFDNKKLENDLQNYKQLFLLKKDTDKLDIKKIDKIIESYLKLDELHSLKSIWMLNIHEEGKANKSAIDNAKKHLEMYSTVKATIKGSITFLENAKKRNNKNAITANDNDEFLEGNIGDEAEKKSSWI